MTVGDGANDVRNVGASGARDVAESHLFTLNCCCEQQRRCGVAPVELLLRAAETLRRHTPSNAVARSRNVALATLE